MMENVLIIDLENVNSQNFDIILNEQNTTLQIYQIENDIFLDLYLNNEPVFIGIKCVYGIPVLQFTNKYKGNFMFLNINNEVQLMNYVNFGKNLKLYYYT